MALKFTNTKNAGNNVNVLVYGRSGCGKTTLCKTAPKPVIISTETGLLSIADQDIPVIEVEDLDDLHDAYDLLKSKKGDMFDTVCLDSLSDIADSVLSKLKKTCKDPRKAYGELNSGMADIIRQFRDMDKNVYFIAAVDVYEMPSGIQGFRPSMPGKSLTNDLPYFFDEVLFYNVTEDEDEEDDLQRFLQTRPSHNIEAKDRSGKLKKFEEPNLAKLFDKLASKASKKKKKKK